MTHASRYQQIRRVLIATLIANVAVAAAKLGVGLISSSLAMIADGFHSSLDAASNVIGLAGSVIASRPPDADHPYGHRRFETLASLIIGGLLLLSAWEIVKGSVGRLISGGSPHIGELNFIAMGLTLAVNIVVTLYESRAGKRLKSEFLLADAEHTRSDVLVSLTVLVGLVAVRLGAGWVDAAAALGVVGLIGLAAWRIVSRSAGILLDHVALDAGAVGEVVGEVPGVRRVGRVRSRGPADEIHLDLDVQVSAPTTAGEGDSIAREIRSRLRQRFGGLADIQVYFLPTFEGPPDYPRLARAEADALGIGVHEVIDTQSEDGLTLEMHIEVAPELSVGEAHAIVTEFEERLMQSLPDVRRVVTHIEPAHRHEDGQGDGRRAHDLAGRALGLAEKLFPANHWHDIDIRAEADGGYAVSMHCHVPADMPLEEAHQLAETVETQVRAALPALHRVTIHTEPPD